MLVFATAVTSNCKLYCNCIFSSVIKGYSYFLKHLIAEHHRLFNNFFPNKRLLPKHHFMVHYPTCILKIGPFLHSWCTRYEAKQDFFKKQLKSFKNVTKTLAEKPKSKYHTVGRHFTQTEF